MRHLLQYGNSCRHQVIASMRSSVKNTSVRVYSHSKMNCEKSIFFELPDSSCRGSDGLNSPHDVSSVSRCCHRRHHHRCYSNCCDGSVCCPAILGQLSIQTQSCLWQCDLHRRAIAPLPDPRRWQNWMPWTVLGWKHRWLHRISKNNLWDRQQWGLRYNGRQTLCMANAESFPPVEVERLEIK